jgi:Asp-tRNA(Asn)/Glu-tRNA(Gln) amidotransferase A subunit family amidase
MGRDGSYRSATAIAAAIREGERSALSVIEATFDRIEARNEATNAFCTIAPDRARESARDVDRAIAAGETVGLLAGVPIGVKDLIDVAGVRTTYGSMAFAEHIPERSALVVSRLEAAGAVIVGKTNTPEFGRKPMTSNLLFGTTANPWNTDRTAGGSSGGSAAALADGLVPLALGTDAAGSLRIPSSACGTYALVPEFGRIARGPASTRTDAFVPIQPYGHVGPMSRTVADTALALDVLAGPHPADPHSLPEQPAAEPYREVVRSIGDDQPLDGLDIAYSPDLGIGRYEEGVERTVADAVETFEAAGADVSSIESVFEDSWQTLFEALSTLLQVRYAGLYDDLGRNAGIDLLDPGPEVEITGEVTSRIEKAMEVSAIDFKRAERVRTSAYDAIQDVFERYDLLCTPLLTTVPFPKDTEPAAIDGEAIHPLHGWHLAWPLNLTGNPAASLPAGFVNGLPVGLQAVGPRRADERVLRASAAFERERPWQDAYPPQ